MVYNGVVNYEWDESKRAYTLADRSVDFAWISDFEWDTAVTRRSDRSGEMRWVSLGLIGDRVFHVVWTQRGDRTRVISMRKAKSREVREYVQGRA